MKTRRILSIMLLIATLFYFCKKQNADIAKIIERTSYYSNYIDAFTMGEIYSDAEIVVRLKYDLIDSSKINQNVDNKLFSFSPSIEGTTMYIDSKTVKFKPKEKLKRGQTYIASFALQKIMTVPDSLKEFKFVFAVRNQSVKMVFDKFSPYKDNDLSKYYLVGYINTYDNEAAENIQKATKVTQDGNNLNFKITAQNNRKFVLLIDSIERKNNLSNIVVDIDGKSLGANENLSKEFAIPALNTFNVVDVKTQVYPELLIRVIFSDPLNPKQEIKGKIFYGKFFTYNYIIKSNELLIYPTSEIKSEDNFEIDKSIENVDRKKLTVDFVKKLELQKILPDIKFLSSGVILPSTNEAKISFEAINVKFVDVKITKIFQNNILNFLHFSSLSENYQLARYGQPIIEKTIKLDDYIEPNEWKSYSIDINNLIRREPGAIYNISLSVDPSYSIFDCPDIPKVDEVSQQNKVDNSKFTLQELYMEYDYYDYNYVYVDYNYDYDYDYYYYDDETKSDDFCRRLKYYRKTAKQNVLATDLGITAKIGENKQLYVFVNNITTSEPLSGTEVSVYNYQLQAINTGKTNSDGVFVCELKQKPFLVMVNDGKQQSYLRISNENLLSMSEFNISGERVQSGSKGFIYTERGVWRPGDSIFVTLILRDPAITQNNHPVIFELYNPRGILIDKKTITKHTNGFYCQAFATSQDAPTGKYNLRVVAGANIMEKKLSVEAIKPNRLKIDVDIDPDTLYADYPNKIKISARWLHGAPAANYTVNCYISYHNTKTSFANFKDYQFDNVDNEYNIFSKSEYLLFSDILNEDGKTWYKHEDSYTEVPGMLDAYIRTVVYEPGGDFSTDFTIVKASFFKSYAGIKSPKKPKQLYLATDSIHTFEVANVTQQGKPISESTLEINVFKHDWHSWYNYYYNINEYIIKDYDKPYYTTKVKIKNGKGSFQIKIPHDDWGLYYIEAKDPKSEHIASFIEYFDWYGFNRQNQNNKFYAAMLQLSVDKENYKIGENVNIYLPAPQGSTAYITVENGTKILETYVVKEKNGSINFSFKTNEQMLPNAYVFVQLIQPHKNTIDGLPIRMYGVVNINVEDNNTKLNPVITCDNIVRPNTQTTIKVSEKNNREMTYTLAIVDDGLLSITKFQTPDPHSRFFSREALGVRTWDMYSDVISAMKGNTQRILSIGGDEGLYKKPNILKANRFKPFVRFIGPFELNKGKTNEHKIDIPNYFGSARIMVVAAHNNSYGNAEKDITIRSPLIIVGTAPRVIGPNEQFSVPLSVFANEQNIKDVTLTIETNDLLSSTAKTQKVTFTRTGEKNANFNVKVGNKLGIAKIKITAQSGNETAYWEVELDVRPQNPEITKTVDYTIAANQTQKIDVQPLGIAGTNENIIEISSFVPLNLTKWLSYLYNYPYGCAEQTISGSFPLIYAKELAFSPDIFSQKIENKINSAIKKIQLLQLSNGGVAMWPGSEYPDDWVTSYAGHFLIEAKNKGFVISDKFISKWKQYQQNKVNTWRSNKTEYNNEQIQAYRLYTLALAGSADIGAMNFLAEQKNLSNQTLWILANAYSIAGRDDLSQNIINKITNTTKYSAQPYTYGSYYRDLAFALELYTRSRNSSQAVNILKEISQTLTTAYWLNTQELGQLLRSIALYIQKYPVSNKIGFDVTIDGKTQNIETQNLLHTIKLDPSKKQQVSIKNTTNGTLYLRLIQKGIPLVDQQTNSYSNNISIDLTYTDLDGISVSIDSLKQASYFVANIKVTNTGTIGTIKSLALTYAIPSGWEIITNRYNVDEEENEDEKENKNITYQDIRDDRIITYFDLPQNQSITIKVRLSATYKGKFYLPGTYCEAMYDNRAKAFLKGKWVRVI